jgi:hypothetical protein
MDGTSAVVRMTPGRDRRRRAEIHPDDYLRAVSATRLNRALNVTDRLPPCWRAFRGGPGCGARL